MAQEFLPLCDILFNIISLASYFCDVVFDVVTVYTLHASAQTPWLVVTASCIMLSLLVSQLLSLRWHFRQQSGCSRAGRLPVVAVVHLAQFGVLWRYFKLFLPVDLGVVKGEVRDLCMLRLVHAFLEAAPMLLVQLYLIWQKNSSEEVSDLNLVSTFLSLFSVCWALASFNKNVRKKNIHKLVLTWLGVIFQFFWRLGTVSSRVVVLTVYATLYHYYLYLVMGLHWLTMFLWLISPKNVFHGEAMSLKKKMLYSIMIAFVYNFCYINVQEVNTRQKMVIFYVTMFLENALLMAVFLFLKGSDAWYHDISLAVAVGGFFLGLVFMLLYYRFFHAQHLKHSLGISGDIESSSDQNIKPGNLTDTELVAKLTDKDLYLKTRSIMPYHNSNGHFQNGVVSGIPGVFNCRLNPAFKRKKKKPTTFVPPPSLNNTSKTSNPFWKRIPTKSCSSDLESSVGSRVNIQQKLQEKKQQQLQELKEIEEEIKQGKLKRPLPNEMGDQGTLRQPIPTAKKQPWLKPEVRLPSYHALIGPHILCPKSKKRSQTPEILLLPEKLDSSAYHRDYPSNSNHYLASPPHVVYPKNSGMATSHSNSSHSNKSTASKTKKRHRNIATVRESIPTPVNVRESIPTPVIVRESIPCRCQTYEVNYSTTYNVPSDLDSQISLPRSYTLPREFRYYRRTRPKKQVRQEHLIPSNNSSDGDVDSADDNDDVYISYHRAIARQRNNHTPYRNCIATSGKVHETKL